MNLQEYTDSELSFSTHYSQPISDLNMDFKMKNIKKLSLSKLQKSDSIIQHIWENEDFYELAENQSYFAPK